MNQSDFKEFQAMLPKRYASRFDRLGTFHNFAGDKSMIDIHDFSNTLDVFAEMETDNKDILITPTLKKKGHIRGNDFEDISSFDFRCQIIGSDLIQCDNESNDYTKI